MSGAVACSLALPALAGGLGVASAVMVDAPSGSRSAADAVCRSGPSAPLVAELALPEEAAPKFPPAPDPVANPAARAAAKLAATLRKAGNAGEAEKLLRDSLAAQEAQAGGADAGLDPLYDQLVDLLLASNRLAEAEALARRAATAVEARHPKQPAAAAALNRLAEVLRQENRLTDAETLYRRVLAMDELGLGLEHPTAAIHANNLGLVLMQTGREREAEKCFRHSLEVLERALGPEHLLVANTLNNLGLLLRNLHRFDESETLQVRALGIYESRLPPDHPSVAVSLENLASVLQEAGRAREAEPFLRRALAIDEKAFGPAHPAVIRNLNNLSVTVLRDQRPEEALTLLRQVLASSETVFGADHPNLDAPLHNLAQLLATQGHFAEADTLSRRRYAVIANYERQSGQSYPRWTEHLLQHAEILNQQGILTQVEVQERLLAETRKHFGAEHLYVAGLERALGEYLMANLESSKARLHFETALRLCRKQPQGQIPARLVQVGLAAAWREMGDIDHARALLAQVLTEWELDPKPVWTAVGEAAFELAVCDFRSGRLSESERWIRKSLASYRQVSGSSSSVDGFIEQASAVCEQILQAQGKSSQEIRQLLAAMLSH